ncbi:uncharacterized protein GIQ15_02896 [Arthroderma uncinatum]|uniref:uncharacterized protein n=1 Tax=Arthroderma uncinatum TaxID=74035 RepID=UPI00144A89FA|nr:uncharacterized protein GIQ15_02896 [Arthroderma uncinatum]KAF3483572.1 hypothetical protein GIQ15_02896 [Arthroderma uncinatum]
MDPLAGLAEALSQCQHHYNEALKLIQTTSKKHHTTQRELELASRKLEEYDAEKAHQMDVISSLREELSALKSTVKKLEQQLPDGDSARLQDDDATYEKSLHDNRKKYDPESVVSAFKPSPGTADYHHYSRVFRLYRELYEENTNWIRAFCKLRRNHKASKEKLIVWNHLMEKNSFETAVNGEKVVFQRASPSHPERSIILESPILPRMRTHRHLSWDGNVKDPIPSQLPEHYSDPASTQSQDLRYDERRLPPPESPDTPMIVSERPVRRQRAGNPTYCPVKVEQSPTDGGTAAKPFDVKSEPIPSSPIQIASIPHHTNQAEEHTYDPMSSPILDPIDSPLPRPKLAVLPDQGSTTPILQDDKLELDANQSTGSHGKKRGRRALQPVDTNVTPLRKSTKDHVEPQSKRRRPDFSRGAHAVPSVAEDGEAEEYLAGRRSLRSSAAASAKKNTPVAKMRQTRLLDLLETQHTPRPILLLTPQTASAKSNQFATPRAPGNKTEIKMTPATSLPNDVQQLDSHRVAASSLEVDNDDELLPETRYRDRPVHELGLEHFKVNPNRNQGLDYVFEEVVRDKSMRKQLRGCLRQECCGPIYRRMAKDELGEEPRPLSSLTGAELDLLREDLGNNYKLTLERSSSVEIRNMLLEAKACVLSNKYSKHRSAHARGRTPPGYWRTDMPSTQEVELDRKTAQKLEREKVLDRYKEACKDNGHWKFADE